METSETPGAITAHVIRWRCKHPVRALKDLDQLNELRYHTIPETLRSRKDDGEAFLEKAELVSLVDWKLYVEYI